MTGAAEPVHSPGGRAPAPDLEVTGARPDLRAAAPTLVFEARMTEPNDVPIYTVALHCQINIDPAHRSYDDESRERLVELFGDPARWGATTKSFLWQQVDVLVPSFRGETTFDIPVPCTYDTELAAERYFYSLTAGEAPLTFHPRGSIFFEAEGGRLQIVQIPWDRQARFGLPVETWRGLMDRYYPNSGWVRLSAETLDALQRHKARTGATSYDACIAELLASSEGGG